MWSLKAAIGPWTSSRFAVWLGPSGPHQLRWCGATAPAFSGLICLYTSPQRETGIINRTQTPTTGRTESFRGATREERQQMKCNCNGSREAGLACRSHWCVWETEREWTGPDMREWGSKWKTQKLDRKYAARSQHNKDGGMEISNEEPLLQLGIKKVDFEMKLS